MLLDLVVLGVVVAMSIAVPALLVSHNRSRLKGWRQTVEGYGLTVVKASKLPVFLRLTARSGPVEIRIKEEKEDVRVVATVQGPPDLSKVSIRREHILLASRREIETGDEKFDDTFLVKGPQPFVRALLDSQVRRRLMQAKAEGLLEFSDGELRFEGQETKLAQILGLFRDLGRRFADRQELPRRLLENVRHDPKPGVRLQNLLVLIREYPGDPSTTRALHVGSKDSDVEIRLRAAQELGAEGRGVLQELAAGLRDDAVSAQAVTILDAALPLERLRTILDGARKRGMAEAARACLETLARFGSVAVATLAEVTAGDSFELAVTAARGLGATGDPAAEPPLLAALARDNPELQAAAAAALGRVGSAAAVLPLQDAAERSGALRRAARQAIAEIQDRLEGTPGQLSLASTEAGQLSLAAEAGQLSLAPRTAERVPLPHPPQREG